MNANQIINMIIRIIMRKTINAGINKGMGMANKTRAGKSKKLSPEEEADFQEFQRQKKLARKKANQANPIDRQ